MTPGSFVFQATIRAIVAAAIGILAADRWLTAHKPRKPAVIGRAQAKGARLVRRVDL